MDAELLRRLEAAVAEGETPSEEARAAVAEAKARLERQDRALDRIAQAVKPAVGEPGSDRAAWAEAVAETVEAAIRSAGAASLRAFDREKEAASLRMRVRDLTKCLRWFRGNADVSRPTVESAIAAADCDAADEGRRPDAATPAHARDDEIDAIRERQTRCDIHPLTCGNDSNHAVLEPHRLPNGKVVLYCPDCGYVQADFPGAFVRPSAPSAQVAEADGDAFHAEAVAVVEQALAEGLLPGSGDEVNHRLIDIVQAEMRRATGLAG